MKSKSATPTEEELYQVWSEGLAFTTHLQRKWHDMKKKKLMTFTEEDIDEVRGFIESHRRACLRLKTISGRKLARARRLEGEKVEVPA